MFKALYYNHLLNIKSIKNTFIHEISIIGSLKRFRKELRIGKEMKFGIRPTLTSLQVDIFQSKPRLAFSDHFWLLLGLKVLPE